MDPHFPTSNRAEAPASGAEFEQLRQLVIGDDLVDLRDTRERIRYLDQVMRRQEERFAAAISELDLNQERSTQRLHSQIGPRAFAWLEEQAGSVEAHDAVGHMLASPVEAALRSSAVQNRDGLAHVLGPVLGPGIRASVAEFFHRFVTQLDTVLRSANIPQRLWWRVCALRDGVPFSEYVLQRTARYAVIQAQLIDKSSGEVLAEVSNPGLSQHAATFTSQSLVANGLLHQALPEWESVRVPGRRLVMQVRTLGGGGEAVRTRIGALLANWEEELSQHSLETLPLSVQERIQISLATLLSSRLPKHRKPWLGRLLVLTVAGALIWWGVLAYQKQIRERTFVAILRATPGYVITQVTHADGKLHLEGLRDPLAADPKALTANFFGNASAVDFVFAPYLSADNEFERRRKSEAERNEAQAQMTLLEKTDQQNAQLKAIMARQDSAIRERVISALGGTLPDGVKLEWNRDRLIASGAMPESLLAALKEEAIRMAPMANIDYSEVVPIPEVISPQRALEAMDIPFVNGSPQFESTSEEMINLVLEQIQKVDANSAHERNYRLRAWPINGDRVEGNQAMQLMRLTAVQRQLRALGYPVERFLPSITETETLSGRRGVWVEVLPEGK
jgi:hypothetical protein